MLKAGNEMYLCCLDVIYFNGPVEGWKSTSHSTVSEWSCEGVVVLCWSEYERVGLLCVRFTIDFIIGVTVEHVTIWNFIWIGNGNPCVKTYLFTA